MKNVWKRRREDAGFTLIELVVTMLCASIIMFAAMTWLLVGIRVETSAINTMDRQQTARMIITLMESMTNSGKVAKVQGISARTVAEGEEPLEGAAGTDWALLDENDKVLLRYRAGSGTIVSGSGSVLMGGLEHASGSFAVDTKLLSVSLSADGQKYASNIFCRTALDSQNYGTAELLGLTQAQMSAMADRTAARRLAFLTLLSSQYGSDGEIVDPSGRYDWNYFTECYLNATGNHAAWSTGAGAEWGPETPWCGTFVSWALYHMNPRTLEVRPDQMVLYSVPLFATVDDGRALFDEAYARSVDPPGGVVMGKDHTGEAVGWWVDAHPKDVSGNALAPAVPAAGDLVFFDWKDDKGLQDGRLEHVGVVLYVNEEQGQIFTIEGNSDGKVALRSYSLTDTDIVGYGVLDWMES